MNHDGVSKENLHFVNQSKKGGFFCIAAFSERSSKLVLGVSIAL